MPASDFLVIGGGIVGLSVARELRRRYPAAVVTLLEKEPECGGHASGRNSGVLHAGFYSSADSLKTRFTRDGNREMAAYCESRGLPVRRCGKLVVARNESEHAVLDELAARAAANGVLLEKITEAEARKIEPRAKTAGRALFSPTTAAVNPLEVMTSLEADCRAAGVEIRLGTRYLGSAGSNRSTIRTNEGDFSAGFIVNCAGLQADRVAREFGFSQGYRILPFKGLYLESDEAAGSLKCHVYPVPASTNPFLGVHLTLRPDGSSKIGPTALPALWRESYGGVQGFRAGEFLEVGARALSLLLSSRFAFSSIAWNEFRKRSRKWMVALASELVEGIRADDFRRWGRPGIRAQLVDIRARSLVSDFVVEGDRRSIHVLNAVSPGFTCAFPFARLICDRIEPASAVRATVSAID